MIGRDPSPRTPRTPNRAGGLAITLLATAALALVSGYSSEAPAGDAAPAVADTLAPDFSLQRLGGGLVRLSELRGKTVVLDFWATWCPPCEFQVLPLNQFYQAHRADGDLEVFGISVDNEGLEVVASWVAEKRVRYPILLGGEDLARRYGARGFPTLIVVGPDGQIHSQHVGLIETDTLEKALAEQRGRPSSRATP